MSDKEKIINEIQRRINLFRKDGKLGSDTEIALYGLINFINAMQEETVSDDLKEEDSFDELLQKLYIKYNKGVSIEKLLDIASNFVKWQKEKDRKGFELLKEWFEEIAERCSRLTSGNVSHNGKAIRGFARNCVEYIKTDLL